MNFCYVVKGEKWNEKGNWKRGREVISFLWFWNWLYESVEYESITNRLIMSLSFAMSWKQWLCVAVRYYATIASEYIRMPLSRPTRNNWDVIASVRSPCPLSLMLGRLGLTSKVLSAISFMAQDKQTKLMNLILHCLLLFQWDVEKFSGGSLFIHGSLLRFWLLI